MPSSTANCRDHEPRRGDASCKTLHVATPEAKRHHGVFDVPRRVSHEQTQPNFDWHDAELPAPTGCPALKPTPRSKHVVGRPQGFLEAFSQDIAKVTDQTTAEALRVDVETIRLQSQSPSPKKGIIKECLGSIKTVLEGTAGNVLGTYLPSVIALIGSM